MATFSIIANPKKEWSIALGRDVRKRLKEEGYSFVRTGGDYTIIIGGDGTLYYNLPRLSGIVILIGSETSYRAQLTRKNWEKKLIPLMQRGRTVRLPILELRAGGKVIANAMNDIVFHTSNHNVVRITFSAGGETKKFVGDGLIIATAFGSSAYSYSAGGRMLPLGSKKVCITPICPHMRAVKPRFGEFGRVRVSTSPNCSLFADGIPVKCPSSAVSFTVSRLRDRYVLYAI